MQIVINIDKEDFEEICMQARIVENTRTPFGRIAQAILHSTPLPKGHGDLIDRDEVEKLDDALCATECGCCVLEGCFYDRADVVIKADRSEEE